MARSVSRNLGVFLSCASLGLTLISCGKGVSKPVGLEDLQTPHKTNTEEAQKEKPNAPTIVPDDKKEEPKYDPRLALECDFSREYFEKKHKKISHCIVAARTCPPSPTTLECKPEITVACDGHLIYANGATQSSLNGFEYLIAHLDISTTIMLMYPSSCWEGSFPTTVESWLTVGVHKYSGSCKIDQILDYPKPI